MQQIDKQNEKELKGLVYSIQRYCIHDGPGIRTTVFFKGCELFCPWCANPESQSPKREIVWQPNKCKGCGYCAGVCPMGAIEMAPEPKLDRDKCNLCGECVRACLNDAWRIYGEEYTVDEMVAEIEKDMPFYRKSGGGVTFSGGEPTMQAKFVQQTAARCKQKGIHTAMETHGSAKEQVYRDLAPVIDLFLIDIKHMDAQKLRRVTGARAQVVQQNIRMLAGELQKKLSIRVPLVPGFNDDEAALKAIIAFAAKIQQTGNLQTVNILPYHEMGKGKYELLGREYLMEGTVPPTDEQAEAVVQMFLDAGLPAVLGG